MYNGPRGNSNVKSEVRQTLDRLCEPEQVVEVRILNAEDGQRTDSGYFDDMDRLADAIVDYDGAVPAIYITLNPVKPDLIARANNRIETRVSTTTGNNDIARRTYLLLDFDPSRPAGTSSSDTEHEATLERANKVMKWLDGRGWPEPVVADSGNGTHLLYRIDVPNDKAIDEMVQRVTQAIGKRFSDDTVKVDQGVHNAGRLIKLYGTMACKGGNTADRPHRRSRIVSMPEDEREVVTVEQLQAVAALKPRTEKPLRRSGSYADDHVIIDEIKRTLQPQMVEIGRHYFPGQISEEGDETRVHGNGGLLINLQEGIWFHFDGAQGGDVLDLIGYGEFRSGYDKNGEQFPYVLKIAAKRAGIPLPNQLPGRGTSKAALEGTESSRSDGTTPAVSPDEQYPSEGLESLMRYHDRQERGDAELFAKLHRERVVYDVTNKQWLLWSGHAWQVDRRGTVKLLVEHVAEQYEMAANNLLRTTVGSLHSKDTDEAGKLTDKANETAKQAIDKNSDLQKSFLTRARKLRTRHYSDDVLVLAQSLPNIAVESSQFDADPMLLGVKNGVIDLHTGEFRPGRPCDYIRTVTPTDWEGIDAPAPRWTRFVSEIFTDEAMTAFMQRLLGYGITGLTSEHVLPVLYGDEGRNGKSTMLEVLRNVLGEYARSVSNDVLIDQVRGRSVGAAQSYLADLEGRRLTWTSETREGDRLNAAQVKLITGGDTINTRRLYGEQFTFEPTHKLLLLTNYKPHVNAEDTALWARVLLIPFELRFVDDPQKSNERKADKKLNETLAQERSGILAWLVRGCLGWQQEGLNAPDSVKLATDEYRSGEDTIRDFIDETCHVDPGARASGKSLYAAYKTWAMDNGLPGMSSTAFGTRMTHRFTKSRERNGMQYRGIGVLAQRTHLVPNR